VQEFTEYKGYGEGIGKFLLCGRLYWVSKVNRMLRRLLMRLSLPAGLLKRPLRLYINPLKRRQTSTFLRQQ
jgi:hypothetical protein